MSRQESFRFKRFGIADSRSGMKLGTDAVLLGAWVDVVGCREVLDVGAGSGILSLMVAQRCADCRVAALEIDCGAAADARENFAASPWADRLALVEGDFSAYCHPRPIDLIISNPPYFSEGMESPDAIRAQARHAQRLTYSTLIDYASAALAPQGSLALVAPAECADDIIYRLEMARLKVRRQCMVSGVAGKESVRVLLQARRSDGPLEITTLSVRKSDGLPTDEFRHLTSDFYLKF